MAPDSTNPAPQRQCETEPEDSATADDYVMALEAEVKRLREEQSCDPTIKALTLRNKTLQEQLHRLKRDLEFDELSRRK